MYLLEHLCEYFAKFGTVENATVKFDKSGRSKGFGFVLFENRDSTDKVKDFPSILSSIIITNLFRSIHKIYM